MYCGDETGAFIGDVGSHTARFGYGGEDCPKVVIPSVKNLSACISDNDVGLLPIYSSLNSNASHQKSNLNNNDGTIQDIDAWASLWEYSYSALCVRGKGKHTRGYKYEPELQPEEGSPKLSQTIISSSQQQSIDGPIDHPLLAVDSTSRTISTAIQEKQRAQMLETLFESLSAPAAYIAPSPMLSSFAYGRSTALVIDIGHSGSRVTPLVDGHCLSSGSVSSGRGAKWLGNIQQSVLEGTWSVDGTSVVKKWNGWKVSDEGDAGMPPCRGKGIIPRYLLPSSEKYSQSKMQLLKQSPFHSMAIHEVMYEMMTSSHMLPLDITKSETAPFCGYGEVREDMATDNDVVMAEDKKEEENEEEEDEDSEEPTYVLPDGTSVNLTKSKAGKDLCRLPELLFSETLPSFVHPSTSDSSSTYSDSMLPLQKLIHKSLTEILDIDLRKELSSNIVLTGGASLFPTLDKRLSVELGTVLPSSYKYKIVASKNTVENRYSAWIGGSILSSLGSFQQLWLSKKEYEECGPVLGLQRFKS